MKPTPILFAGEVPAGATMTLLGMQWLPLPFRPVELLIPAAWQAFELHAITLGNVSALAPHAAPVPGSFFAEAHPSLMWPTVVGPTVVAKLRVKNLRARPVFFRAVLHGMYRMTEGSDPAVERTRGHETEVASISLQLEAGQTEGFTVPLQRPCRLRRVVAPGGVSPWLLVESLEEGRELHLRITNEHDRRIDSPLSLLLEATE